MAKEILCGFGVDVDAVAGWLRSYGGEDSPDDTSGGLFAGEVGSPRLLKLFARLDIKTTWFIPGHSIETFPNEMKAVAAAGHEIGIHGYSHENPIAMTREQEMAIHFMHYNFVRIHQTLRITPAMAAGVTTKLWDLTDMVRVIEDWETARSAKPGDRLV